ncbi:MAG: cytochrome c [Gammaproteobacteria bacterium]|nr:MAG: cytochrome c [Gammaproteobacteria bacterium]
MAVSVLYLLTAQIVMADDNPQLGENVSQADLVVVDYTIMPNGEGLPDGSGTAAEGAKVYQDNCLACHGAGGKDGLNDVLVGGHGSLTTDRPQKTVGSYWPYATTLFDYVHRAMPYQAPGSLSDDDVYAVTAYILYLNDVVDENEQLDADTLPDVRMPNRDNFVWAYSPD